MDALKRLLEHPGRGGCGVGAIADPSRPSHDIVELAVGGLGCLEHRGGGIEGTGDGAGLLLSVDRPFFSRFLSPGRRLPEHDELSVGVIFFPAGEAGNAPPLQARIDAIVRRQGLSPLGWRRVPLEVGALGAHARASAREPWQLIIGQGMLARADLRLACFRVKAEIERQMPSLYVVSLAPGLVVYKALATGEQLRAAYPDLRELKAQVAVFHRRYSTNTLSNWALAQPFRLLAHNGEINTIKANRGAVLSLEKELSLGGVLMQLGSDSADLDRAVELFVTHGVSLPETILRLMPASWRETYAEGTPEAHFSRGVQRALGTLAAWEGPAGVVAFDGETVVAALDRMGLRPLRYLRTTGGRFIVASELGAIPVPFEEIAETGQLDPGEVIAFTPGTGILEKPAELRKRIATSTRLNTDELSEQKIRALPPPDASYPPLEGERLLALFGWSPDRLKTVKSMAAEGKEPVVGMGYDRPLAVFSRAHPPLSRYLKQVVAVVTNPPIDPIREGGAFDLTVHLGPAPDAHEDLPVYDVHAQWRLGSPLLTPSQLREIETGWDPLALALDATCEAPATGRSLGDALSQLARAAVQAVRKGIASVLILTDRRALTDAGQLPLPMLLAVASVHNALTQEGLRRHASIVCDTGEVSEGHDLAVLIGNGATAVCPWLLLRAGGGGEKLLKSLEGTLKRVMSKMGICSIDGYRGARLFEAIGLAPEVTDFYLPGVASRVGGIDLDDLADDLNARRGDKDMRRAEDTAVYRKEVWQSLQESARGNPDAWTRFLRLVDETPPVYLRDLLRFRRQPQSVPVSEVEGPEQLVAAHLRGAAMSHGALHRTAHRAIAAAFNQLGGMSNCGEGGEDVRRNRGGAWEDCRSKVRQVGSACFGVDAAYLVNADEIEIKIGQGAKPGEGGMLPAAKVTAEIAAIRRTRPGVVLISPPPHHDIYSIEDLAQLVFSLRAVNPRARICVKCPAVSDLGTIAVGVAKAGADVIAVSGYEGGTGAANASSIEHAGLPLELGLTDAHQALTLHGVRKAVKLRADGGIKTGADVAKLLALGADEVSLGTALMIAEQCIYCHGCSKGNCPAGITAGDDTHSRKLMQPKTAAVRASLAIAEPDPELHEQERFLDARNAVQRYLVDLASDLRRHLAAVGLRTGAELVGRVDLLEQTEGHGFPVTRAEAEGRSIGEGHGFPVTRAEAEGRGIGEAVERARAVDLSALLIDMQPVAAAPATPSCCPSVSLDEPLIAAAREAGVLRHEGPVTTASRSVGARISGAIAEGSLRLREPALIDLTGCAGQGFGFGLVEGVTLRLRGFANDTVGAAMSGGRIVIVPGAVHDTGKSLVGNAAAYGATGGELLVAGRAGQRFGVRNSAATLVCEGAGKYAFEYMTGGVGVVLGPVGPVVGSGMTGGELFLLDDGSLDDKLSPDVQWAELDAAAQQRLQALLLLFAEATGTATVPMMARFRRAVPAG